MDPLPKADDEIVVRVGLNFQRALRGYIGSHRPLLICLPILVACLVLQIGMVITGMADVTTLYFVIVPAGLISNVLRSALTLSRAKEYYLRLDQQGAVQSTANSATQTKWTMVRSIRRSLGVIYIETNNHQGENLWVATDVFASKDEANRTWKVIGERFRAGKAEVASGRHSHWERTTVDYMYLYAAASVVGVVGSFLHLPELPVALVYLVLMAFAYRDAMRKGAFVNAGKHYRKGKYGDALKLLEEQLLEDPNYDFIQPALLASLCATRLHDYEKAQRYAERALSVDPKSSGALLIDMSLNLRLRRADAALAKIDLAFEATPQPKQAGIAATKLWALTDAGKIDEAIAYGVQERLKSPQSADLQINLTYAYIVANRFDDALSCIEPAVALKFSDELLAERNKLLALVNLGLGNIAAARANIEGAMKLRPTESKIRTIQALFLARDGKWTEARSVVNDVIATDKYCAEAFWLRQRIHEHDGNAEAAAADAEAQRKLNYTSYLDVLLPAAEASGV